MTNLSSYTLKQFITDSEQAVRSYSGEVEVLRHLKPLLQKLVQSPDSVPPEAFKPREDRFAMNLIYMPKDNAYSIIAGIWKPGQTTPIHDHLTWALIGVYDGEERQSIYRRTDDRSNPKSASIVKVDESTNKKGHVTVLGEAGIHRVDNVSDKSALSVHVYGRDIGSTERHAYDPTSGEVSTFVSGYCNVLRDPYKY